MISPQLPLSVQVPDATSFDNFYPGPNVEALAAVLRIAQHADGAPVLLHGPAGSGKTHLLQAAVRLGAGLGAVAYLPLADFQPATPALLDGLDQARLLALDDVDQAVMQPDFAQALLRLLDSLRTQGRAYLATSRLSADRLDERLPADLRTRFALSAQFPLKLLDDAQLAALLQARARRRGLELPDEVADFLLRRLPRRIPSLLDALETLDRAALSAQRRLTIPFATQALPALAQTAARTTPG